MSWPESLKFLIFNISRTAVQMLWNVKLFKDSYPGVDVKQYLYDSPEVIVAAVMVKHVYAKTAHGTRSPDGKELIRTQKM